MHVACIGHFDLRVLPERHAPLVQHQPLLAGAAAAHRFYMYRQLHAPAKDSLLPNPPSHISFISGTCGRLPDIRLI
jgi:hypothetical protein